MSNRYPVTKNALPTRRLLFIVLGAVALITPVAVYVAVFGLDISHDHARWGEMGSAMSGIYSPLIALITLLVLAGQLRLQKQIANYQFDQAHIDQCRADIQYYLEQLDRALQLKDPSGSTVRQILHQQFQPSQRSTLVDPALLSFARLLNQQYPQPFSMWSAIYPVLAGLRGPGKYPYEHHAVGTVQKMVAMITFESCASLDNFHHCLTEGRTGISYEFSPLVRSDTK